MRRYLPILSIILALALGSCVKEDGADPTSDPVRVLLVYVGTDNNLSGLEQDKLQALREGWTGRSTDRIIVYRDTRGTDARLIEISNLAPGEQPREIATYGVENSGDPAHSDMNNSASPETLRQIIADVRDMFPAAESFGLLIFSHASGWLPQGIYNEFAENKIPEGALSYSDNTSGNISTSSTQTYSSAVTGYPSLLGANSESDTRSGACDTRSIIIDGTDEMDLTDFAEAIPDGVFDYIVFEACFMAGIEVAYELRYKAPYIFASSAEVVHPGFAPAYPSAVRYILEGKDLARFGQCVFNHALAYAEGSMQRSAAYSVIRTDRLGALAAFIKANCDFSRYPDIATVQRFDRLKTATLFFDFEDYYGRLLDTDAQRAELARMVADCIQWKAAPESFMNSQHSFNGFDIVCHSGLTTFIPQQEYPGLSTAYSQTAWGSIITGHSQ